jgi:hypothetical protein
LGAAFVAAAIRRREEDVRQDFHRANALQPIDAKPLADIGLEENVTLRRLVRHSVVREAQPGLFYFDEDVWQSVRATRRRMVIILLVVLALVGIMTLYGVATFK